MKKYITFLIAAPLLLVSCDFSKSVHKDLVTGLLTKGDGLSCDEVYLTSAGQKISRSTFTYGDKIQFNFEDISGFVDKEGYVFPGMEMTVLSETADSLLYYPNLYSEDAQGFNFSPLDLSTSLVMADPLHSNNTFEVLINIWDKNGEGSFSASMEIEIKPNDHIEVTSDQVLFGEIYLYSAAQGKVLTGNTANLDEDIYLIFEGLEGFQEENGYVFPGLSITATDAAGNTLLDEPELIGDAGMESSQFTEQLAPNFQFSGTDIENPVTCEIRVWDKRSDRSISALVSLVIE